MARQADDGQAVRTMVVAMSMGGQGQAPEIIQLLPFGEHKTDKGMVILDKAGADMVMDFYKASQTDPVIDYEHQTLSGNEAPAAGWVTELENKGADGIWGKVSWCKRAAEMLNNREYRYLSPVFLRDKKNRVVKFLHAALTNTPAIDGMEPVVAKQEVNGGNAATKKEETIKMDNILKALGLAATATVDEAIAAITSLKETAGKIPVACKGVLTALGLTDGASESETVGTIVAMKSGSDKTSELAARVKTLSDKLAARDADELVQVALKAGKISPAQNDWAKKYAAEDPEGFKVFVAKAPVVVPMGNEHKEPAPEPTSQELTAAEVVACKQLGISVEDFKKHNKKA
ncbi:MAG: phage protease [Elusimicrobia bacterium]|nr:phage protease [Elusimicrobiota bacterium]